MAASKNKKAIIKETVATSKTPHWIGLPNIENTHLAWRFSKADLGGSYHCADFSHDDYQQLWNRLRAFEGMNSNDLRNAGSLHDIPIDHLSPDAQERLRELKLDDIDILYSFRIDGMCRLWCLRFQNMFCVLWWDREHEVYPVGKRNT